MGLCVQHEGAKGLHLLLCPDPCPLSAQSSMDSQRRDEVAAAAAPAQPLPMPTAPPPAAAWGFSGDAESFPSLGQMQDAPKRATSVRGAAAATPSSAPDTQKGSQAGSAPKMGFANAVSGEPCDRTDAVMLICIAALCVRAWQQDRLWLSLNPANVLSGELPRTTACIQTAYASHIGIVALHDWWFSVEDTMTELAESALYEIESKV